MRTYLTRVVCDDCGAVVDTDPNLEGSYPGWINVNVTAAGPLVESTPEQHYLDLCPCCRDKHGAVLGTDKLAVWVQNRVGEISKTRPLHILSIVTSLWFPCRVLPREV